MEQFVYGFLTAGVLAILILPWFFWEMEDRRKENRSKYAWEKQSNEPESQNEVEEVNAQDLFIETLTKIGCQYKVDEESDRRIHFDYQGEHFFADINEGISFVHLYDTYWLEVELNKTDEVSRLKKAINTANQSVPVTTLFTIDDDDKCMYVHSRYSFVFGKNIPSLDDYLKAILYYFFEAHRIVATEANATGTGE